jgi:glycosyltransferase involved in cell wall biosynthesis
MQFGIDADRPVILFFGLLKPYKGLDVLLRAMVPLSKAEPSVMLWIVGKATCSTHPYRHLMRRLGVSEKVTWQRGYLPWRMVTPAFAAADVIVLPYRQASASAVLVTAFANERPVVASAIGPLAEMIEHGATGLLFPVGDPEALANSVVSLLSNSPVRARMGRRAGEIAEQRHGWDHIADRTDAVYRAVLRSEA